MQITYSLVLGREDGDLDPLPAIQKQVVAKIVDAILAVEASGAFVSAGGGMSGKPAKTRKAVAAALTVTKGSVVAIDARRYQDATSQFELSHERDGTAVDLRWILREPRLSPALRVTLLDELVTATRTIIGAVKDASYIRGTIHVQMPYSHVRPPRRAGVFPFSSIVAVVDDRDRTAWAQALAKTPPKKPATQEVLTKHVTLTRWIDTLSDNTALADRLSGAEQWIVAAVDPPIEWNFNAAGDQLVRRDDDDLYLDAKSWPKLVAAARTGKHGEVWAVAKTRAEALELVARAKSDGLRGVAYTSKENPESDSEPGLWDPMPEGPWLTE